MFGETSFFFKFSLDRMDETGETTLKTQKHYCAGWVYKLSIHLIAPKTTAVL